MNTTIITLRRGLVCAVVALACVLCTGWNTALAQDDSYDINIVGMEELEGTETVTVQFANQDDDDGSDDLLETTHTFVGNSCNAGFAVPPAAAVQGIIFRGQFFPVVCGSVVVRVGLGCFILKVCRIGRIVIITIAYYRWCPC